MPYVSQAQAGYFHTHEAELAKQGVNVKEWDQASKGMSLPKRAPPRSQGDLRSPATPRSSPAKGSVAEAFSKKAPRD